jgi:hypothetical protein
MSKKYNELLEFINTEFQSGAIDKDLFSSYKSLIKNEKYFNLINNIGNGGFFFGSSLQLYGYTKVYDFHNIEEINKLIKLEYGNIASGFIFFGQDIFGNQFGFKDQESKIIFFNIETGDHEIIANDIDDWVDLIFEEEEYFTGSKLYQIWRTEHKLDFNQRLSPKVPFILNGEYSINNLYASVFPTYIKTAASIAKQVYNLPDGTNFKIKIDNN